MPSECHVAVPQGMLYRKKKIPIFLLGIESKTVYSIKFTFNKLPDRVKMVSHTGNIYVRIYGSVDFYDVMSSTYSTCFLLISPVTVLLEPASDRSSAPDAFHYITYCYTTGVSWLNEFKKTVLSNVIALLMLSNFIALLMLSSFTFFDGFWKFDSITSTTNLPR